MSSRKRQRNPPRSRSVPAPPPAAATQTTSTTRNLRQKRERKPNAAANPPKTSATSKKSTKSTRDPVVAPEPFENCGICLDAVKERGVLSVCTHQFCFDCIMTWSKTANTCPVCKRVFNEIRPMGSDGKKPKSRRARYLIKDKKQEWQPTREDLLRAAGVLDGSDSSEEDESYDPDLFPARDLALPALVDSDDEDDEESDESSDDTDSSEAAAIFYTSQAILNAMAFGGPMLNNVALGMLTDLLNAPPTPPPADQRDLYPHLGRHSGRR